MLRHMPHSKMLKRAPIHAFERNQGSPVAVCRADAREQLEAVGCIADQRIDNGLQRLLLGVTGRQSQFMHL